MRTLMKSEGLRGRMGAALAPWLLALSCAATGAAEPGGADDGAAPAAPHFSGFGTLGLTHNDNRDAGVIADFSQKKAAGHGWSARLDSVLGLQMEWQLLPQSSVLFQGVARASMDGEPQLRMGYWRQQLGGEVAVRLGRFRSPLYFDSDVAEIGYAYLTARTAMPLYSVMNMVRSLDGADLQWRHTLGSTVLLAQAYYGNTRNHHRFANTGTEADVDVDGVRGLALNAILANVRLRASRTWLRDYRMRSADITQLNQGLGQLAGGLRAMAADPRLPPAMAAALGAQAGQISGFTNPYDNRPIYTSIGLDATLDDWRLLGEWAQLDSQTRMVGKYNGYQLTIGRSFGELTPYVSLARQRRSAASRVDTSAFAVATGNPALDGAAAQLKAGLEQAAQFADISTRAASVGLRWDFRENMALKVQFDRLTTPGATVPGIFPVRSLPFDNRVNLFTLALDAVF